MDDLISRQAAIDAFLTELTKRERKNLLHTWSTVEVKYFVVDMLEKSPSAQPERKKGKWVEVAVTDGYDKDGIKTWISVMQCDQCGFIVNAVEGHMAQYNYCPNCGADMRGE